MTGALIYLTRRTVVNRIKRQAARVQSPRYALALVLGCAWLAVVVWQRSPASVQAPASAAWLELGGALGVLLLAVWSWLGSGDARVLAFSPAEVTFLFPAPITRRGLIRYKLLRTQLIVLVNVAIWTVLVGRQGSGLSPWLRAAGFWVLITTLALHRLGAALVRASLAEHGRFGLRHRIVSVVLVSTALGALASGLWASWPDLVAAAHAGGVALREAVGRAAAHPGIAIVLWPLRLLARPLGAASEQEWRAAILPAIGLLALHYLWVLRSDTAFEEAAAEASLARARRQAARAADGVAVPRSGRPLSPPLFPLAPTGWPPIALLWKNLAAVARRRRAVGIGLGVGAGGAVVAIASSNPESTLSQITGTLALTWLGLVVLLGPQWVRNDLRRDLVHADLLRSYPLRGWAVVAMEASASAITLTLVELVLAAVGYLAFLNDTTLEVSRLDRTLMLAAALVILPPLNLLMMLLQNGAAVLFPGWVRIGGPPTGIEALGQQVLSTTAAWLMLAVTLATPAALATVTFFTLASSNRPAALVAAVVAGLAALATEVAELVRWLGRAFERLEPSAVQS